VAFSVSGHISDKQSQCGFIAEMNIKKNLTKMDSIKRLKYLMQIIPSLLEQIDDAHFCEKTDIGRWSKKEILGHLIDSATNNHHRFIRAQFEDNPKIVYNQDDWCKYGYYQAISKRQIIILWHAYNLQIAELIINIPEKALKRKANDLTLEFLIDDYVTHLEHHLKQIVNYT